MDQFVGRSARATLAAVFALAVFAGSVQAAASLNAYRVKATGKNIKALAKAGFDVTEGRTASAAPSTSSAPPRRSPPPR